MVLPIPVDYSNLPFLFRQFFPHLIGNDGTAGAVSQNNQFFHKSASILRLLKKDNNFYAFVMNFHKNFQKISVGDLLKQECSLPFNVNSSYRLHIPLINPIIFLSLPNRGKKVLTAWGGWDTQA
jgi:hypothetical protein